MRRKSWKRRGNEAVEYALVLPVLFGLTVGALELFWFLATASALQTAVGTGARAGSVSASEEVTANAETEALATWDAYGYGGGATFMVVEVGAAPNLEVEVTGTLTYRSLTGLLPPPAVPGALTRTVRMHLEDQVP